MSVCGYKISEHFFPSFFFGKNKCRHLTITVFLKNSARNTKIFTGRVPKKNIFFSRAPCRMREQYPKIPPNRETSSKPVVYPLPYGN